MTDKSHKRAQNIADEFVPHFIEVVGSMKDKLEQLTGEKNIEKIIKPEIQFAKELNRLKSELTAKENQISSMLI